MEKRKIVAVAVIVVAVLLVICFAVSFIGQGRLSKTVKSDLNTTDIENASEFESVSDASTENVHAGNDGGDAANLVSSKGAEPGANSSSGNSGSTAPQWPGGNPPADDGSTTQGVTYSQYQNMSAAEQQAWYDSFESADAFFAWYNQAKAVHDANDDSIIIDGNTSIDMGEIAKKKS